MGRGGGGAFIHITEIVWVWDMLPASLSLCHSNLKHFLGKSFQLQRNENEEKPLLQSKAIFFSQNV